MTADERCPHCGSEDYGPVNEGHEQCCAACGYDTEHGTLGVCPGGKHPCDNRARRSVVRGVCCDDCYKRLPRDLPDHPKFRTELRVTFQLDDYRSPFRGAIRQDRDTIYDAIRAWLTDNPRETSNP